MHKVYVHVANNPFEEIRYKFYISDVLAMETYVEVEFDKSLIAEKETHSQFLKYVEASMKRSPLKVRGPQQNDVIWTGFNEEVIDYLIDHFYVGLPDEYLIKTDYAVAEIIFDECITGYKTDAFYETTEVEHIGKYGFTPSGFSFASYFPEEDSAIFSDNIFSPNELIHRICEENHIVGQHLGLKANQPLIERVELV